MSDSDRAAGLRLYRSYDLTGREVLREVGRCIYCGSRDGPLSDEHVIPYGLEGHAVLGAASCESCAKIATTFERTIARGTFHIARTRWEFQTRRPKERPPTFTATLIDRTGSRRSVEIPATEFPVSLNFPVFAPPAEIEGEVASRRPLLHFLEIQVAPRTGIDALLARYDAERIERTATVNAGAFGQLMAKIAYGHAIADGIVFSDVFVVPLILGMGTDLGRWVGNMDPTPQAPATSLHTVATLETGDVVIGLVRLFAALGAPEYTVVVGRAAAQGTSTV